MCDCVTVTHGTVTPICMSDLWGQAGKIDFPSLCLPDQFAVMAKVNKQAKAAKKKRSAEQREAAIQCAIITQTPRKSQCWLAIVIGCNWVL